MCEGLGIDGAYALILCGNYTCVLFYVVWCLCCVSVDMFVCACEYVCVCLCVQMCEVSQGKQRGSVSFCSSKLALKAAL